jgi:ribosome-associated protein
LGRRGTHARFKPLAGDQPLTKKTAAAKKTSAKNTKKSVKAPPKKAAKTKAKKAGTPRPRKAAPQSDLLKRIVQSLEDDKAEAIVTIDLEGRSSLCDAAVIASGRSSRHVMAIADHLARRLKEEGYGTRPVTGAAQGDWALVDAGDVIVHVFRPEVRDYYDLEGMWNVASPNRA